MLKEPPGQRIYVAMTAEVGRRIAESWDLSLDEEVFEAEIGEGAIDRLTYLALRFLDGP